MSIAELPPALRPWSASLAFLTVEAALHLGPLVRRLDDLVRRHDATAAEQGEPDGYGGLTTRGRPDQLLLSEWLLADELPLEFLRRAANRELLHIKPVARAPRSSGRVAVYCDVGSDQLGASRLVQLAALVVLHRRATASGSELVLGLSSEEPHRWHRGELPELFAAWRAGRRADLTTLADLQARDAAVDDADELWVLSGRALATSCGDRRRMLSTRETAWDEQGATTVEVRFEARTITLALPTGPVSVQTLRGTALRRTQHGPSIAAAGALSCPSFPSADRRLLLRGETANEIVVTAVPTNPGGGDARPKTHRFPGPVIAASSLGRRLVVLVVVDAELQCRVVGKHLGRVGELRIPLAELGLTPRQIVHDRLTATLPPLHYDREMLLCRVGDDWWLLPQGRPPLRRPELVAAGPGWALDVPKRYVLLGDGTTLHDDDARHAIIGHDIVPAALRVVVGAHSIAWSTDERWHIRGDDMQPTTISIDDRETVLGLLTADRRDDPALVTRSSSGTLVRLRATSAGKTLTACSGPALAHALHPILPLLAVQRDEETVEIHDIALGTRVSTVRAG